MSVARRLLFFGLISLLLAGFGRPANADDSPQITYDMYQRDTCLTVILDLTPFITARTVERLGDGVDLLLRCDLRLVVPRRLWGSRQVAEKVLVLKVSYRPVTEEYLLERSEPADSEPRHFLSLAALYAHLRDSVECCLANLDSLDSRSRHELEIKITAVTLTDLSPAGIEEPDDGGSSPVGFLFREFLDLTGYGRKEYTARSRPFSLSELDPPPGRP